MGDDVAPTELDWFWGFETTNMPRRRRYGARVVSTRRVGMGWMVKIIRRCLFAGVLRLGTSRAPKWRSADAALLRENDECGFLPKAATPRLETKIGHESSTGANGTSDKFEIKISLLKFLLEEANRISVENISSSDWDSQTQRIPTTNLPCVKESNRELVSLSQFRISPNLHTQKFGR